MTSTPPSRAATSSCPCCRCATSACSPRPPWPSSSPRPARCGRSRSRRAPGARVLALAQSDERRARPAGPARHRHGRRRRRGRAAPGRRRTASSWTGCSRARAVSVVGDDVLVAEVELLDEGDAGDEWGPAVEALARYLHAHADLRSFLDQQRRSPEPMSWVNLACQHLPITATARQRLLESDAPDALPARSAAASTPCSARSRGPERRRRRRRPARAPSPATRSSPRSARARTSSSSCSASSPRGSWARRLRRVQHGVRVRRPVPDPARLRHVVRVDARHQPRPVAGRSAWSEACSGSRPCSRAWPRSRSASPSARSSLRRRHLDRGRGPVRSTSS